MIFDIGTLRPHNRRADPKGVSNNGRAKPAATPSVSCKPRGAGGYGLKGRHAAFRALAQQLLKQETVSGGAVKEALQNSPGPGAPPDSAHFENQVVAADTRAAAR